MKKLTTIMTLMVMLLLSGVCFAGNVWIDGYVTNGEGRGIGGASLSWAMLDGTITVYTASNGYYGFLYNRNWCDNKYVWVSATGYIPIRRGVPDGSCCDCYPDCNPADPYTRCSGHVQANFTLNGPDSDGDGYYDIEDNCPTVPNGPDGGTCTAGTNVGSDCNRHADCGGCLAFCSLRQEDSDGDGIGDACDGGFMSMSTENRISAQSIVAKNNVLNLFALWLPWYCAAYGCDAECLGQQIEDIMNGRDFFLGRPTTPEPIPLTYECPDFVTFEELVNILMDNLFDLFYGDNFPDK